MRFIFNWIILLFIVSLSGCMVYSPPPVYVPPPKTIVLSEPVVVAPPIKTVVVTRPVRRVFIY